MCCGSRGPYGTPQLVGRFRRSRARKRKSESPGARCRRAVRTPGTGRARTRVQTGAGGQELRVVRAAFDHAVYCQHQCRQAIANQCWVILIENRRRKVAGKIRRGVRKEHRTATG